MSLAVYQVDAFTDTRFTGNPAAVCILPTPRTTDWMQDVAAEMNLSETAFLRPQDNGSYHLRWFTPTHEVDLCGHATLASAHVLWREGFLSPSSVAHFDTNSGPLTATRDSDWIAMDFPSDPVRPTSPPADLLEALGIEEPVSVAHSTRDYLIQCRSATDVRTLAPDMTALSAVNRRGVIVTAASDNEEVDFVSRFFAPAVGVPEDPVTGSAHCALGPFWTEKLGHTTLTGRQISDRGGMVQVHLESPTADRVKLSGQAVTVLRSRLSG